MTTVSTGGHTIALALSQPSLKTSIKSAFWHSRGWTFQEYMLSSRCLVFTRNQVYFTSRDGQCSEAYGLVSNESTRQLENRSRSNGKRVTTYDRLSRQKPLNEEWYRLIVEAYTARSLTHVGDRLDAFGGLAPLANKADISSESLAALSGLPLAYFPASLMWLHTQERASRHSGGVASDHHMRLEYDTQRTRHLPSWSWAGSTGPVKYLLSVVSLAGFDLPLAKIMDGANIRLDHSLETPRSVWPVQPTPVLPWTPGVVTVHAWAECLRCRFAHEPYGISLALQRHGSYR